MKFNERWVREWADPPIDTDELVERLTAAGLEVESVAPVAGPLRHVTVAEIVRVTPHPGADRLTLCEVNDGGAGTYRVVCGAPNVRPGMRSAYARVGARLADGSKIRRSRIRGEVSQGMLCSERELGLGEDTDGILELEADAPLGMDLVEWLDLDDVVIEVGLTPNRGDCLCIAGIAREVAVASRVAMRPHERSAAVAPRIDDVLSVALDAPRRCPRYVGRIVRGIDPAARTPRWMTERLRRCGVRPLSPVVDVTNYVMLELGQPMHAFDCARLDSGIRVRNGREGERLTLLDGTVVELDDDTLVIADESRPVALAGVMGGLASGVDDATTDIFLESAWFEPRTVALEARRRGMHTDASHRFERTVASDLQRRAMERATGLLVGIAGGEPGSSRRSRRRGAHPARRARRASQGASPPRAWRRDSGAGRSRHPDPARDAGRRDARRLDRDPSAAPARHRHRGRPHRGGRASRRIREPAGNAAGGRPGHLPAGGAQCRSGTYPRTARGPRISRGGDLQLRRRRAAGTHRSGARKRCPDQSDRVGHGGHAHDPVARSRRRRDLQRQQTAVAGPPVRDRTCLHGRGRPDPSAERWSAESRLDTSCPSSGPIRPEWWTSTTSRAMSSPCWYCRGVKPGSSQTPTLRCIPDRPRRSCAAANASGRSARSIHDLRPSLKLPGAVLFELRLDAISTGTVPKFNALSRFPAVRRDLSLVAPEAISASAVRECIEQAGVDVLENLELFDVYVGEGIDSGMKSVSLALTFQSRSRTLGDTDINAALRVILDSLAERLGIALRE